jgi:hypothetical protein
MTKDLVMREGEGCVRSGMGEHVRFCLRRMQSRISSQLQNHLFVPLLLNMGVC